ncbi:putative tyrosyl-DNA phosphodiesterase [Blattella germanica]|nr:putative tyrosyl-DNA phosphodiesterase [Blattella germanica]
MRRLVHEPDSPPRASSYLQNSDKDAVPRTDIKNKLGSPSISEVRNTEKSSLVSGNNSEGNPVVSGGQASTIKKGFAARLAAAAPYNFFLTAIRDSPPTHREPLSVCFHQLLDPSMGDLDSSLQINFMVELDWLMEQYKVFGHDKMSLFYYKDNSLRVVVSTANLISSDWYNRTQGVWVSPACPELPPDADTRAGESPSEFKADLLRYISNYHLPALQEWMSRLRRTDFSAIRVCFVASVPGSHRGQDGEKWGHRRLGHLLRKFAVIPSLLSPAASKESWPVISQCSSIGTLGGDPDSWMCGELRTSFSQKMLRPGDMPQPPPPFRVIYPSLRNVKNSHDDLLGGACLPYSRRTHEKQLWFRKFLFEWKSDKRHRSKAMPHIKTYSRVSPCGRHLSWFHLTSANLSKAAWGKIQEAKGKNGTTGLYIMSYEAGVLFLPKLLVNEQVFRLDGDIKGPDHNPPFPLPWDLPLSAYAADDEPFVHEYMD